MNEKDILEALGQAEDKYISEASPESLRSGKRNVVKRCIAAACFVLIVSLGVFVPRVKAFLRDAKSAPTLSENSHNVTVKYADRISPVTAEYDLIYLTEDELFTYFDTEIFKGTVTKIENMIINMNGDDSFYRAVAEIKVEKVYRGSCLPGSTVTLLLPCPVNAEVWVEDTETVSFLSLGMTGIFMPVKYGVTSVFETNGASLLLRDLAEYGLPDGSRYAFLQTDSGLIYASWAYESIAGASTLDEVESYILKMIEK